MLRGPASFFYYTDARFDTRLGTKTTDNLTEGSTNLYFTNTRADARAESRLTPGSDGLSIRRNQAHWLQRAPSAFHRIQCIESVPDLSVSRIDSL